MLSTIGSETPHADSPAKIALIVCYFGDWPAWFPAYLHSCRHNPSIDWFILTDIPTPPKVPANVRFISSTLERVQKLATEKLGFPVVLNRPYKLCDLKPAYGLVFDELLRDYDFWGHTDLDIVWGDIRAFITDSALLEYDVLSARRERISGHFTLFRNDSSVNTLFREDPRFPEFMQKDHPFYYDEVGMTELVQRYRAEHPLRVFWPRFLLNFADPERDASQGPSRLGKLVDGWFWKNGKIYECGGEPKEIMYLHFMTWKKSLKRCEFGFADEPESFYVSYSHIGLERTVPKSYAANSVGYIKGFISDLLLSAR